MFNTVYVEKEVKHSPRTEKVLDLLKPQNLIEIEKYTEVFNRHNQNFRLQKKTPKLILAEKKEHFVLIAPEKCKLGVLESYYFSHLYNCPFDCEYCYLQGNYNSGYLVWFQNYERFFQEISEIVQQSCNPTYFFSGFDCDSLALESVTGFAEAFIPFFESLPNTTLELRTKSANIQTLLKIPTPQNTVLAWTLTPVFIQENFEKKTATLAQRIKVINQMLALGWRVGIRFEPMLFVSNWKEVYTDFFTSLIQKIDFSRLEDINLGTLHYPKEMYKKLRKIIPNSKLITGPFTLDNCGEMRYFQNIDSAMKDLAYSKLAKVISPTKIFIV